MWSEEKLHDLLTTPSKRLIDDLSRLDGDIMLLGAGGKMGPTMSILAARAVKEGRLDKKVYAVSRFSDENVKAELEENGVIVIKADLQKSEDIASLPDVRNIIFMVGRKFGTDGSEALTWGMNAVVPTLVLERFKGATFVVFSSGNIYAQVPPSSGVSPESLSAEAFAFSPSSNSILSFRIFPFNNLIDCFFFSSLEQLAGILLTFAVHLLSSSLTIGGIAGVCSKNLIKSSALLKVILK